MIEAIFTEGAKFWKMNYRRFISRVMMAVSGIRVMSQRQQDLNRPIKNMLRPAGLR